MSRQHHNQTTPNCRSVRKQLRAFAQAQAVNRVYDAQHQAIAQHMQSCARCASEYRLLALSRTALDLAAAPESFRPDETFFVALKARLARGEAARLPIAVNEDSWAAALRMTARQLIPAMALLLLLILGATLLWKQSPSGSQAAVMRPRDKVMFNDMYDYPAPTRDDVLETLVAVEE